MPVEVVGLANTPVAGDEATVVPDERKSQRSGICFVKANSEMSV